MLLVTQMPDPGLDIGTLNRQKQGKVFPVAQSLYARWRVQTGAVSLLHEQADPPPERLLQAVWQHQRLRRDQLATLDGQPVRILHPGFIHREGGPDFRNAVIQFGSAAPVAGDVEVDIHPGGWRAHGHDRNPAFHNVILHVIWDGDSPVAGAPTTLAIRTRLDAPVAELGLWLNSEEADAFPENLRSQCCASLRELSSEQLSTLLAQAAQIRFRAKASQFQARARQAGWEQALWEGVFRALGYKHNAWPMQCLAERRDRWSASRLSPLALQARLLGISGLLPVDLTRARISADGYLRRVWDRWWRERDEFADCILPRSLWRFHGQRPANHPQRRLALASHWLASKNLAADVERWCAAALDDRPAESLLEILQVGPDEFWSWHWTIRSGRLKKGQPLLGSARVTDLAVNVILPWLWIRAVEGQNSILQTAIERRFNDWPAAEDNAVLRLARQRLLGDASARRAGGQGAAAQQGWIQIARDFCEHSDSTCANCLFPELVREFQKQ